MWNTMQRVVYLWVIVGLLRSCSSEVIKCDVTKIDDGTLYSVAEYTGSDCLHTWIENGTVIANPEAKNEQVVTQSNRTLVTHKCYEEINFTCHCFSGTEFSARCTTNCSGNAGSLKIEGTPASHWIAPVLSMSLLLIGGCCYLAHRHGVFSRGGRVNQLNHQADGGVI